MSDTDSSVLVPLLFFKPGLATVPVMRLSLVTEGGGVQCVGEGSPIVANNLIAGNSTTTEEPYYGWGGGMLCFLDSSPVLLNNTIVWNSTNWGGGIACVTGSPVTMRNCIVWGNSAPNGSQIALLGSGSGDPVVATVSYADIHGGRAGVYSSSSAILNWGSGNFIVNPLFVGDNDGRGADDEAGTEDDNYHLKSMAGHWTEAGFVPDNVTSACIDAGDTQEEPHDPEWQGK